MIHRNAVLFSELADGRYAIGNVVVDEALAIRSVVPGIDQDGGISGGNRKRGGKKQKCSQ